MKISRLNSFYSFTNNYKQSQNIQDRKANFIYKENYTSIPLESWQANTITSIKKINFKGTEDKKQTPIYIFLGPPLAGKGTTAELLSKKKNIPVISIGKILREEAEQGSKLGKIAQSYSDKGELAPSDIVMGIVEERIDREDYQNGVIFDGFPRKVNEAKMFLDIIKQRNEQGKNYSIKVVNFDVDEETLLQRAEKRRQTQNRTDDAPETVKTRIRVYHKETKPVKIFFNEMGILKNIKITQKSSQTGVFEDVLDLVEEE